MRPKTSRVSTRPSVASSTWVSPQQLSALEIPDAFRILCWRPGLQYASRQRHPMEPVKIAVTSLAMTKPQAAGEVQSALS